MVHIIPNFLALNFGENVTKIQTKIVKLQMHKNLYKNVNENIIHMFMQIFMSFYDGRLRQQMLYAANILSAF